MAYEAIVGKQIFLNESIPSKLLINQFPSVFFLLVKTWPQNVIRTSLILYYQFNTLQIIRESCQ